MGELGLTGVPDASSLFLADRRTGVPGSAVLPTLEGQRPMLVEVQALTNVTTSGAPPRRSVQGLDPGRLALLLAVLDRRARISTATTEVYASVVGGTRLGEPGADLALCLALVSALAGKPLPPDLVVFGEVGLAGEVRQVGHAKRRLIEAARLGFRRAIVPAHSPDGVEGMSVHRVATLTEALSAAGLTGP
jgi:DNA repair protein RadA/Sms